MITHDSVPITYFWIDEIPHSMCDLFINIGKSIPQYQASTFSDDTLTEPKEIRNKNVRDSSVAWIDNRWITGMLFSYAKIANKEAWRYSLFYDQETFPCQFTTYDKNGHYGWHQDTGDPKQFSEDGGAQRKISLVLQLSDPSTYEGGDFQMRNLDGIENLDPSLKKKGTIIVFPSYLSHRVTPVTSGVRHSLVAWYLGPPFV